MPCANRQRSASSRGKINVGHPYGRAPEMNDGCLPIVDGSQRMLNGIEWSPLACRHWAQWTTGSP
jgi:hypothetical protein